MSVENLKKYGELCSTDEHVRARAKEIGLQDLGGHIAYGKSLGLEFSMEDFAALSKEVGLDEKNELSEEDLKKVAGGYATLTAFVIVIGMVSGAAMGSIVAEARKW
jgi:predicted ribosomally synthesized peptide with nif11-like leader